MPAARTLDNTLADKRFAKNKLERAISDAAYAFDSYAEEMEQAALMAEAKKHLSNVNVRDRR